jgi:hypothetical protein
VWWCGSNQIPWIDGICGNCTGAGEKMALIYIGSQVKGRASHQICQITTTNLPTVHRCGLLWCSQSSALCAVLVRLQVLCMVYFQMWQLSNFILSLNACEKSTPWDELVDVWWLHRTWWCGAHECQKMVTTRDSCRVDLGMLTSRHFPSYLLQHLTLSCVKFSVTLYCIWSTASLMDGWFLSCWISGSSTDQWEEDTGATGCRTATGNVLSISFCDQLLHV